MPKPIIRIVALLLVPTLAADPVTAAVFSSRTQPAIQRTHVPVMQTQALTLTLGGALFTTAITYPQVFLQVFDELRAYGPTALADAAQSDVATAGSSWLLGSVVLGMIMGPLFAKPGDEAGSQKRRRQDPQKVQALIGQTQSRKEAIQILKERLGWEPSPENLSQFMTHHDLTAPWQIPRQDPQKVQSLIGQTHIQAEAIQILNDQLGWGPSPQNLSHYMTHHDLTAPWQIESGPRQDPQKVQSLIGQTHTPAEAIQILNDQLGWEPSPESLSHYMTRHGLTAPWRRGKKFISKVVITLPVIFAVQWALNHFLPGSSPSDVVLADSSWLLGPVVLRMMLERLSPPYRSLLQGKYLEGKSFADIARERRTTRQAVARQFPKALRALHMAIGSRTKISRKLSLWMPVSLAAYWALSHFLPGTAHPGAVFAGVALIAATTSPRRASGGLTLEQFSEGLDALLKDEGKRASDYRGNSLKYAGLYKNGNRLWNDVSFLIHLVNPEANLDEADFWESVFFVLPAYIAKENEAARLGTIWNRAENDILKEFISHYSAESSNLFDKVVILRQQPLYQENPEMLTEEDLEGIRQSLQEARPNAWFDFEQFVRLTFPQPLDGHSVGEGSERDEHHLLSTERVTYEHEFKRVLNAVLKTLTPTERFVLRRLYQNGETYEEIGLQFPKAVSPQRVGQIVFKALRKLRHPSRSSQLIDPDQNIIKWLESRPIQRWQSSKKILLIPAILAADWALNNLLPGAVQYDVVFAGASWLLGSAVLAMVMGPLFSKPGDPEGGVKPLLARDGGSSGPGKQEFAAEPLVEEKADVSENAAAPEEAQKPGTIYFDVRLPQPEDISVQEALYKLLYSKKNPDGEKGSSLAVFLLSMSGAFGIGSLLGLMPLAVVLLAVTIVHQWSDRPRTSASPAYYRRVLGAA